LILWRHAEARTAVPILREADARGRGQAAAHRRLLKPRCPGGAKFWSAPPYARQQTALALGVPFVLHPRWAPKRLHAASLPRSMAGTFPGDADRRTPPTLGRVAATLLSDTQSVGDIGKGALWAAAFRRRDQVVRRPSTPSCVIQAALNVD